LREGTDLSVYSQAKLNAVARRLNKRLRKTLDYETPAERFKQTIASTGGIHRQTETLKVIW
jgi:IS30 family transposase